MFHLFNGQVTTGAGITSARESKDVIGGVQNLNEIKLEKTHKTVMRANQVLLDFSGKHSLK